MSKLPLKSAIFMVILLTGIVNAQFVSPSSSRSYSMGGGAESLCDDSLSILDNLATMGRNADYRGQFAVSMGINKFWDYDLQDWNEPEDMLLLSYHRLVLTPTRKAEENQFALWVNTLTPAMTWVGIARDGQDVTYRISTQASIKEFGFGFGIGISDNFHMGLGAGLGIATTQTKLHNLSNGTKTTETGLGVYLLPVGHVDLELFIIPQLCLSVNSLIFGYTASEDAPKDISEAPGTYLAGSGLFQASASLAWELSPIFHVSGGYKLSKITPPTYSEVDLSGFIHSLSIGVEWVIMVKGAFMQLALRSGFFIENLNGSTDTTADVYKQVKKGVRFGIALKLGKLTLELAMSGVLDDEGFNLDREPTYFSVGILF